MRSGASRPSQKSRRPAARRHEARRSLGSRTLYALLVWAALHSAVVECGYAPHYAPGLMSKVAHNRDMPQAACMVSSPTLPIGSWVWVYGQRTGALLRCRVTDVSHPRDRARHLRTRRLVELDYAVTRALCGATDEPSAACKVIIVRL